MPDIACGGGGWVVGGGKLVEGGLNVGETTPVEFEILRLDSNYHRI